MTLIMKESVERQQWKKETNDNSSNHIVTHTHTHTHTHKVKIAE